MKRVIQKLNEYKNAYINKCEYERYEYQQFVAKMEQEQTEAGTMLLWGYKLGTNIIREIDEFNKIDTSLYYEESDSYSLNDIKTLCIKNGYKFLPRSQMSDRYINIPDDCTHIIKDTDKYLSSKDFYILLRKEPDLELYRTIDINKDMSMLDFHLNFHSWKHIAMFILLLCLVYMLLVIFHLGNYILV